jgi:hypothetical protein
MLVLRSGLLSEAAASISLPYNRRLKAFGFNRVISACGGLKSLTSNLDFNKQTITGRSTYFPTRAPNRQVFV